MSKESFFSSTMQIHEWIAAVLMQLFERSENGMCCAWLVAYTIH